MRALMLQGTSSSAGKSLLVTALARLLRRRGIDVVPFKAQNMSNNARVVPGGEIGVAQYLQALAAGVQPDVRMNPILVKPEGDTRSQVVVLGEVDHELSALPWRDRGERLWPRALEALDALQREHELVLLEGAGSPAEINLRDTDLANMRSAEASDARVLLVADIDRGGAFAHLVGTWSLLRRDERRRLAGFVLNKFRGDASLLPPGPELVERLTGVPTVGIVPWLRHRLPDEDGAFVTTHAGGPNVVAIRYPTASNLDELKPLEQVANLRWAVRPEELLDAELIVLPGSKHVAADLRWLRETGIAAALHGSAARVLGICGGLQMLGRRIVDEGGVDGTADGLGLLPVDTVYRRPKRVRRTAARFLELPEPWSKLSGAAFDGYEIRHGDTTGDGAALEDALGFVAGRVLGLAVHGAFESPSVLRALVGAAPEDSLDALFDELADAVEPHLEIDRILG
jgi:adenosylcobyric acid synthase